ncbi:hypothetical protein [Eupransor demetentiae]|uniref:Uncharacterized protein n=1 Tax=Eupransor demetentiae TaxID=3109584 RepID=A0ABP0ERK9_9LACO|nr:hypothetical protein R54876_GBNLAHCA_01508 [Lactobacillaceae bacterium LMG 33000]
MGNSKNSIYNLNGKDVTKAEFDDYRRDQQIKMLVFMHYGYLQKCRRTVRELYEKEQVSEEKISEKRMINYLDGLFADLTGSLKEQGVEYDDHFFELRKFLIEKHFETGRSLRRVFDDEIRKPVAHYREEHPEIKGILTYKSGDKVFVQDNKFSESAKMYGRLVTKDDPRTNAYKRFFRLQLRLYAQQHKKA